MSTKSESPPAASPLNRAARRPDARRHRLLETDN